MKKATFFLAVGMMLSSYSCTGQQGRHYERVADSFVEVMENLGEYLEEHGEELANNSGGIRIGKNDPMLTRRFVAESFDALEVERGFFVTMCDTVESIVVHYNAKLKNYLNVRYNKGKLHIGLNHIDNIVSDNGAYCGYVYIPYNLKLNTIMLSGFSVFTTSLPIKTQTFNIELNGASKITTPSIAASKIDCEMSGASKLTSTLKASIVKTELSGASSIAGSINATKIDADLSGASTLSGTVNAENITVDLSGASKMDVKGTTGNIDADVSGASHLYIQDLTISKSLTGELSGASKARVHCNGSIKMEVSGTSELVYSGNPKTDISKSRTAEVTKL